MKIPLSLLVVSVLSVGTFAVPVPSNLSANVDIVRRTVQPRLTAGNEFVGWHGTNNETANLWETTGEIVRPTNVQGQTTGRSGLDAELGPGLYITDTLGVAEAAAAANAQNNKLTGKVCAIFAKSSTTWRASQDKIPERLRGNACLKEQECASYITNLPPANIGLSGTSIRLGPLDTVKNQILIPESQNPNFEAQCFDTVGLDSAGAQAFENEVPEHNVGVFPVNLIFFTWADDECDWKINYTSESLVADWNIRTEDAELVTATVAAFEKAGVDASASGTECVIQ